jgi:hypothetical protein
MSLLRTLIIALGPMLGASVALAQNAPPAKPDAKAAEAKPAAPPTGGRDWTQIDTNKDGYVSPEEMEVWLKANPGPAK